MMHEIIFGAVTIQLVAVRLSVAVGIHIVETIDQALNQTLQRRPRQGWNEGEGYISRGDRPRPT